MARSRSVRSSAAKPQSNAVLIIFLIFFILTTIGAGIFGYSGYTVNENYEAKLKSQKAEVDKANQERDLLDYKRSTTAASSATPTTHGSATSTRRRRRSAGGRRRGCRATTPPAPGSSRRPSKTSTSD